jgi:hypothetical protein
VKANVVDLLICLMKLAEISKALHRLQISTLDSFVICLGRGLEVAGFQDAKLEKREEFWGQASKMPS